MSLPLLLSVPHAGLWVPPEVEALCVLTEKQIITDSDDGAVEIYYPLEKKVAMFVTTNVARAIVDPNRAEDDFRKDGVIKTHTSWNVPVYRHFPSQETIQTLIEKYYKPYHLKLSHFPEDIRLGVDCHTMAAKGPPVGPDPGQERPHICLSNADGTCPQEWMDSLTECLEDAFATKVCINRPFRGGFIVRSHSQELPWVQLELSRAPFLSNEEKRDCVLNALVAWCQKTI